MSAGLFGLRTKYETLLALRLRREEVAASGAIGFSTSEGAKRKRAFRAIARRFPGALRELDLTDAAGLRARLDVVDQGLKEGLRGDEARWAQATVEAHALLRLAQLVRRWQRRRGEGADVASFESFSERLEARCEARGIASWSLEAVAGMLGIPTDEVLPTVTRPPGGRLRPIVEGALRVPAVTSPS